MNKEDSVYKFVSLMLEQETFEDLLERFDVTPEDAFHRLFEVGLIDTEVFENLTRGLEDGTFDDK